MTAETLRLAWRQPARDWAEATPLGNGRIGAMVFGGAQARIQVNDATIWSGRPDGPADALADLVARGAGPERLAEIRSAIDAGDLRRAEALLMGFEGPYSQEFLPFVDLELETRGAAVAEGRPARVLDLDEAYVTEPLVIDGAVATRRTFVSAPAGCLFVEYLADRPVLDVDLRLSTRLREAGRDTAATGITLDVVAPIDGAPLHEPAVQPAHRYLSPEADGFDHFAAAALALRSDGTVGSAGDTLRIRGASRLLIALSTSSRAGLWWADPDGTGWRSSSREEIRERARSNVTAALRQTAHERFAEHLADVREHASGARFAIGGRRVGTWDVECDILHGDDEGLRATVLAEYGRYLLAASSRSGSPAANLQGIWNDELRPPWSSNYTININTQMNYWAAPIVGLDDSTEPLTALVRRIARTGSDVAARLYGARGWVAHHNSDLWGWSLPVGMGHGAPSWAIWMMGGVWLTHNLWDRYEFAGDPELLEHAVWRSCAGRRCSASTGSSTTPRPASCAPSPRPRPRTCSSAPTDGPKRSASRRRWTSPSSERCSSAPAPPSPYLASTTRSTATSPPPSNVSPSSRSAPTAGCANGRRMSRTRPRTTGTCLRWSRSTRSISSTPSARLNSPRRRAASSTPADPGRWAGRGRGRSRSEPGSRRRRSPSATARGEHPVRPRPPPARPRRRIRVGRAPAEPVQHAPALPDRRQLRVHGGDRRAARAEPPRPHPAAARTARAMAERPGSRVAGTRRTRGRPRLGRRRGRQRRDPRCSRRPPPGRRRARRPAGRTRRPGTQRGLATAGRPSRADLTPRPAAASQPPASAARRTNAPAPQTHHTHTHPTGRQ
ncbi:glycoside hydrolase N-terminal domain-containing protein [Micromonospora sp. 4G55]|nr:glycoside hydrolase N-terminal domain-containing protein [Micromonospora sp. 4G55]